MLSRRRQIAVYFTRQIEASGHGGNQNRSLEPLAKECRADIDLIDIELRERIVDEAIAVQSGAEMAGNVGRVETDFEVFFFSFLGGCERPLRPSRRHNQVG